MIKIIFDLVGCIKSTFGRYYIMKLNHFDKWRFVYNTHSARDLYPVIFMLFG